jgi:hypothetical protein
MERLAVELGSFREAILLDNVRYGKKHGTMSFFGVCNKNMQKDYDASDKGIREYLKDRFGYREEKINEIINLLATNAN